MMTMMSWPIEFRYINDVMGKTKETLMMTMMTSWYVESKHNPDKMRHLYCDDDEDNDKLINRIKW